MHIIGHGRYARETYAAPRPTIPTPPTPDRFIGEAESLNGSTVAVVFTDLLNVPVAGYVADSDRVILAEASCSIVGGAGHANGDNFIARIVMTCSVSGDVQAAVGGGNFGGQLAGGYMASVALSAAFTPPAGETVTAVKLQIRTSYGNECVWNDVDPQWPCGHYLWVSEVGPAA